MPDLSRRQLLSGISALLATNSLSAERIIGMIESAAIPWPTNTLKIIPFAKVFTDLDILEHFNTHKDLAEMTSLRGGIRRKEMEEECWKELQADTRWRLGVAWEHNLHFALSIAEKCKELKSILAIGADMPPSEFFSLIETEENRNRMADLLFEEQYGVKYADVPVPEDKEAAQLLEGIYSLRQHLVSGASKLPSRFPVLKSARSFAALVSELEGSITSSLSSLRLEDGCLDRAASHAGSGAIRSVLTRVERFIPQDRRVMLEQAADDFERFGRQMRSFTSNNEKDAELDFRVEDCPYRVGYSDLQNWKTLRQEKLELELR